MGKLVNDVTRVFNQSLKGGLIIIGNTCLVVGEENNKAREFITPNGEYTSNWRESGSSALLEIPPKSYIKYAILEWHSTVSNSKSNGIIKENYFPINFNTPYENVSISTSYDSFSEAEYRDNDDLIHSVKWVDVTEILKKSGNGEYTVKGIPSANPFDNFNIFNDHNQRSGWSLAVVYENNSMPKKNINISIGIKKQDYNLSREISAVTLRNIENSTSYKKANLILVAMNGNPNLYSGLSIYNDTSLINNINSKYALGNPKSSAFNDPNNSPIVPYDNIFSGIIMDTNSESENYRNLNTNGTLGNSNNNPYNLDDQLKYTGNRAKLDILTFDISDKLTDTQDNLTIVSDILNESKSDSFEIITYATEIELDEQEVAVKIENIMTQASTTTGVSNITVSKTANRTTVGLNDAVKYTILISNTTGLPVTGVTLTDTIPINSSLIKNSIIVNGNAYTQNTLLGGIALSDMLVNGTQTVQYSVTFYNLPMPSPVQINPQVNYNFISPTTGTKVNQTFVGTSTVLNVINDPLGRVDLYLSKNSAISKDKILYTLVVKNNGASKASNIILTDLIPQGLQYVLNSLMVSGIPVQGDITKGVSITDIGVGQEVLITFQVSVN